MTPEEIDHWTKEYIRVRDEPGYFEKTYCRLEGDMAIVDNLEELKMGAVNAENSVVVTENNGALNPQRILDRLLSQIQAQEHRDGNQD